MIHVGTPFGHTNKSYNNACKISVGELRELYNKSKYVSALRRIEGFEKPAMEGLLCGARPICFDTPLYRYWYGDLAEYVPECAEKETSKAIEQVFSGEHRAVTNEEMLTAINKFGWRNVSINFWDRLEERGILNV